MRGYLVVHETGVCSLSVAPFDDARLDGRFHLVGFAGRFHLVGFAGYAAVWDAWCGSLVRMLGAAAETGIVSLALIPFSHRPLLILISRRPLEIPFPLAQTRYFLCLVLS